MVNLDENLIVKVDVAIGDLQALSWQLSSCCPTGRIHSTV
ncbi:unnamed protein product [marine sediment metagenome]|uniref:Uncharacterized protein n=1 Tax=marine sediment metagenome TaxID=412755 RepID=X1EJV7_9ZZZZ